MKTVAAGEKGKREKVFPIDYIFWLDIGSTLVFNFHFLYFFIFYILTDFFRRTFSVVFQSIACIFLWFCLQMAAGSSFSLKLEKFSKLTSFRFQSSPVSSFHRSGCWRVIIRMQTFRNISIGSTCFCYKFTFPDNQHHHE